MKSLIPAVSLISLLALAGVSACKDGPQTTNPSGTIEVNHEQLKAGGVYIAYMVGCEKGCDQLAKGDLVMAIDGKPVTSAKDMRTSRVATGAPVKLSVLKPNAAAPIDVEIVAQPQELPPLKDIPPFWTVGAADL
jgi:hypothetical protein